MIQEGLEYSYVTNGLALVLLRVPYEDPGTLYCHLCEPNLEVNPKDDQSFLQPATAIARVLCLCLMSFRSCQNVILQHADIRTFVRHYEVDVDVDV